MPGFEVDVATVVANETTGPSAGKIRRLVGQHEIPIVNTGSAQVTNPVQRMIQDRYFDLNTWDMQIFRGNHEDPDSATGMAACSGVNTNVAALDATNKGWLLQTSAADNDNSVLHPHATGNKMGVAAYWNSTLSPFCAASVLCGPADAQQLVEAEYAVGLDIMETWATKDCAASGETDAARWQVTNGAAGGVATNWKCEQSTASGTDVITDSGNLSQRATFVELAVFVSAARVPYFYYNGKLIKTGTALDDDTIMCPTIGVQVNNVTADDAKGMTVRWAAWGQKYSA